MNNDDWKEWLDNYRKPRLSEFFEDDGSSKHGGKKEGNWHKLKRGNWEELAFYVWYDAVHLDNDSAKDANKSDKDADKDGHKHAQKWTGMLTARLLAELNDGGKKVERLTIAATGLAVIQTLSSIIGANGNNSEVATALTWLQAILAIALLIIVLKPIVKKD